MGTIIFIVILFHLASATEVLPTHDSVHVEERRSELLLNSLHPCGTFCHCHKTFADCSGHYDNLTYIPVLRNGIEMLNFSCNNLENVSKSTFANISNLHLRTLWLRNNNIKHIAENALQYFPDLTALEIGQNPISHSDLRLLLHGLNQSSLQYLNLESLHLHDADQYTFDRIHSMQRLTLSDNLFKKVDCYDWNKLKNLIDLDLSYNKISTFLKASILKVEYVTLRSNNLQTFPDFCTGIDKSKLRVLDLSQNNIISVTHNDVECLTSVTKLLLDSNNLKGIYTNTFSSLSILVTLSLKHAIHYHGVPLVVEGYAFNNSALRRVSFTSATDIVFTTAVSPSAFRGCINLVYIRLSYNSFYSANDNYLTSLFDDMALLKILIMKECGLRFFPEVIAKRLTNIEVLNFYFNNIQTVKNDHFKKLKHLKWIDLGNNGIVAIDSQVFPMSLRHQLKYISLANNSFSCTCNNLWLIEWMKTDAKKFWQFPKDYKCAGPFNPKSTLMINAPLSELICSSSKMFPSIISVTVVTVITLAITSLVYRWRWHIRHYIYVLRYQKGRQRLPNVDVNFNYDAFVLFCDDDLRWVREQLMPKVEEEGGKKLCIHHRDFTPGKYIVDNIIESLEDSRKVMLILSNTFSDSSWCDFELTLVQKRALEMQDGYLVVILLENLEARHMTSSMYALLQTTTYITWPEEEQNQNLFWERVKTSLEE